MSAAKSLILPPYLEAVKDDPAYEWAMAAWRKASRVPGAWFDNAKAQAVIDAWPQIFRLTSSRFKGAPFHLVAWQKITVGLLVGWKKPTEVLDPYTLKPTMVHVRIFRRLDLWIPRKNGKSEFMSGLALLFFMLEKSHRAQGYVFGRNETQGRVPFDKMKALIREGRGLLDDAQGNLRVSLTEASIYIRETESSFFVLNGAPDGKHGREPKVILGDEIHEWISRKLADDLRQGTGTQLQPIELYASTTGHKNGKNRTGYEWFEESMAILRGDIEDESSLIVFFGIGDDDDWNDEAVWRKANPSLGLTPTLDYLRTEYRKAKGRVAHEAIFQCYHLNRWVDSVAGWLPRDKWSACTEDAASWPRLWAENRGRKAYVTCDIGSTRDLTCMVVTIPPDDDHDRLILIPIFWIPEGTLEERAAEDKRVDWKSWVRAGAVRTTPGDATDQNFVQAAINEACGHFDVVAFGYDKWNAAKLVVDLQNDGMPAEIQFEMRQGHQTLGAPTKELERLVFAAAIEHGGHPVLAWMASNCTIRFDANLNYVPDKKNSLEKIDGIVASVMGIGLSSAPPEVEPSSPWDDPDSEDDN